MSDIVKIETIQVSSGRAIGRSFGKRLQMMAMKRKNVSPLQAAISTAEESISIRDKANGKQRTSTARENGRKAREVIVRAGAILSDASGKTASYVADETVRNHEELERQREEKRKEDEKKYGGQPGIVELVCEGLAKLDEEPPVTRRFLLFGGPKKIAKEGVRELAPIILPWPLNKIAALFNFLRH